MSDRAADPIARPEPPEPAAPVSFADVTRVWWRIGWLSFGGPTAQIALMHRMLVEERGWISEAEYLPALGFCMLLPGPEAMQLATYVGWKLHGTRGGLVAGLLFVLPGALVVGTLAAAYAAFGHVPLLFAMFRGVQATALVLVLEALLRIAKRALRTRRDGLIAVLAFVALFAFAVPFPVVVAIAAGVGAIASPPPKGTVAPGASRVPWARMGGTAAAWLAIWTVPLATIAAMFGRANILSQLAWFFSKLAVVTFGGAYAVLAYMSQDVVTRHGWLDARTMLDGLGLAETTPGPLILVTEFFGFLSAHRAAASASAPFAYALLGASVALWATFAPCFLWIFTFAPLVSRIGDWPRLRTALAGITAAVLGVIAHLTVWFAMHVMFARVDAWHSGAVHLARPQWTSFEPVMAGLTLVSGLLLIRRHWSVHRTLATMAAIATAMALAGR